MYELQDWAAVHRVYKQTGSKHQTAEIPGMARNTVKRLLEMTEAPAYHRKPGVTLIDPFRNEGQTPLTGCDESFQKLSNV